jgi:hypothetical protein
MYVKVACIPGRTLLATRKTPENLFIVGYEEGEDIFVGADLDSIVYVDNDLQQLLPFFLRVLKQHMAISLKSVSQSTEDQFADHMLRNVFQTPEAFSELCQASGGVVRDFLNIFRTATLKAQSQGLKRISIAYVRMAAREVYSGKRHGFGDTSAVVLALDSIYQRVVVEEESYFFLVDRVLADHAKIMALFMAKLIHRMPATYYNPNDHKRYRYYQIDYGAYVDLLDYQARLRGRAARLKFVNALKDYPIAPWTKRLERPVQQLTELYARAEALTKPRAGRLDRDPARLIIDQTLIE